MSRDRLLKKKDNVSQCLAAVLHRLVISVLQYLLQLRAHQPLSLSEVVLAKILGLRAVGYRYARIIGSSPFLKPECTLCMGRAAARKEPHVCYRCTPKKGWSHKRCNYESRLRKRIGFRTQGSAWLVWTGLGYAATRFSLSVSCQACLKRDGSWLGSSDRL